MIQHQRLVPNFHVYNRRSASSEWSLSKNEHVLYLPTHWIAWMVQRQRIKLKRWNDGCYWGEVWCAHGVLHFVASWSTVTKSSCWTVFTKIPDVNGAKMMIAPNLPAGQWTTVELEMNPLDKKTIRPDICRLRQTAWGWALYRNDTGLRNMTTHRRLCHAVLNPLTDAVFRRAKAAVRDLKSFIKLMRTMVPPIPTKCQSLRADMSRPGWGRVWYPVGCERNL